MRLLFLCKRFPQGRDLLTRPYGRFYHLPKLLAQKGHDVHIALLSYRRLLSEEACFDGISWSTDDAVPAGPLVYLRRIQSICSSKCPDWIVGFSDTYFGILAYHLARRYGAKSVIDAYDNFESYIPWALPLHYWWRRAVSGADLVTAAGPQLACLLRNHGAQQCEVLPMAADPLFQPLDRKASRTELGLPIDRRLVGHLGAFDATRGSSVVLRAIEQLRHTNPEASLVLSGRTAASLHAPPAIFGLGYIADEKMPALVNSLDVACVALGDNAFGRFSYPVKLYEAMACGVPVVASATGPTSWILDHNARFLACIGSVDAMTERIRSNFALDRANYPCLSSWAASATTFDRVLTMGAAPTTMGACN